MLQTFHGPVGHVDATESACSGAVVIASDAASTDSSSPVLQATTRRIASENQRRMNEGRSKHLSGKKFLQSLPASGPAPSIHCLWMGPASAPPRIVDDPDPRRRI